MRRRSHSEFQEPSLVPLADMLTNTVGIVVFILIFTVLTAGGARVQMQLPREHATKADRALFVCQAGRVFPLDETRLTTSFMKAFKRGKNFVVDGQRLSLDNVDTFVERFNGHEVQAEFFVTTGAMWVDYAAGQIGGMVLFFAPKSGTGETVPAIEQAGSAFRRFLAAHDPKKEYLYFMVYPDSQEVYKEARSIARAAGYSTGWDAQGHAAKIGIDKLGGGRETRAQ